MAYFQILDRLIDQSSVLLHPPYVRWAWITILRHARKGGVVRSMSPVGLSIAAKITLEEATEALRIFTSPDENTHNPDHEGIRLVRDEDEGPWAFRIVTWDAARAEIDRANRAKSAEKSRDAKAAATPKPKKPRTSKPEALPDPEGFAEFWSEYRKKDKRLDAIAAFRKAIESTPPFDIVEGVSRWNDAHRGTKLEFVPLPTTWLNQRRWEDGYDPSEVKRDQWGNEIK